MKILLLTLAVGVLAVANGLGAQKKPAVIMDTSFGTIKIELDEEKAPVTVKNFLSYVDDKFYDGTIFHRVIKDFMIQGGGFEPGMKQKETKAPIKNESLLSNTRGTIAMARLSEPDSATAQFYINVVDNTGLDRPRYCVFGKVIEGMDVVDKIRQVKTETKRLSGKSGEIENHENAPSEDVLIKSVRRAQ